MPAYEPVVSPVFVSTAACISVPPYQTNSVLKYGSTAVTPTKTMRETLSALSLTSVWFVVHVIGPIVMLSKALITETGVPTTPISKCATHPPEVQYLFVPVHASPQVRQLLTVPSGVLQPADGAPQ